MPETTDLDSLVANAEHIFLSLEVLPSKLPRLIQTRAHCKPYLAERPGRTHRLAAAVHLDNLRQHREYLRTVTRPQYLKGPERPLILELTEDFQAAERETVPAGRRMVGGGIHRIVAAWELGWSGIPCRLLTVDAETASRLLIRENSKPYKHARTAADYREKLLLYKRQHGKHASITEAQKMLGISRARVSQLRAIYPDLRPEVADDSPAFERADHPRVLSRRAWAEAKRGLEDLQANARRLSPEQFVDQMVEVIIRVVPDPEIVAKALDWAAEGLPVTFTTGGALKTPMPLSFADGWRLDEWVIDAAAS